MTVFVTGRLYKLCQSRLLPETAILLLVHAMNIFRENNVNCATTNIQIIHETQTTNTHQICM